MRTLFAIVGLFCTCVSAPAAAAPGPIQSGNDFFNYCDSKDDVNQLSCLGWVAGFAQGLETLQTAYGHAEICLPKNSTVPQYRDVILLLLRDRPEVRHLSVDAIALAALTRAFPCKGSN
jgi:Ssp1 endopeptidase immunity protein Rap1a